MIDWRDLHRVATHERNLAGTEAERRRAISCLYYALFHRLCAESASFFAPTGSALAYRLQRSFDHKPMAALCKAYVTALKKGAFEPELSWLGHAPPSPSLAAIAAAFLDLQEHRQISDYDLQTEVSNIDHLRLLQEAEHAHLQLDQLQGTVELRDFLTVLFLRDRWTRRG